LENSIFLNKHGRKDGGEPELISRRLAVLSGGWTSTGIIDWVPFLDCDCFMPGSRLPHRLPCRPRHGTASEFWLKFHWFIWLRWWLF